MGKADTEIFKNTLKSDEKIPQKPGYFLSFYLIISEKRGMIRKSGLFLKSVKVQRKNIFYLKNKCFSVKHRHKPIILLQKILFFHNFKCNWQLLHWKKAIFAHFVN